MTTRPVLVVLARSFRLGALPGLFVARLKQDLLDLVEPRLVRDQVVRALHELARDGIPLLLA